MSSAIDSSLLFSLVFAVALAAGLLVRLWLASRQVRHVARHRDAVPALFAEAITLDSHQRAADYTMAKTRFGTVEMAWHAAVLTGWTLFGGLDWLNKSLLDLLGPGMGQQLALLASFALIGALVELPFTLYGTFKLESDFGFNRTSWPLWLADTVKGACVGAAIGLPLAALILWLMAAAGPLWWLWAWGVWAAFNLTLMVAYPAFIAPLFNRFEPLQDESLKARVTALMQRCGFSAKGLFVMDGSTRSAHANAYFSGFGSSKRVVFYDTLLGQLSPREVEAVLAHELGHFNHRHITKRLTLLLSMSLAGFAAIGWLSAQTWFFTGLSVQPNLAAGAPNDAVALVLFLLAAPVFSFFVTPLATWLSRRHEFEADAYAVAQTSGSDLSTALLKLYKDNASTLTPDPVFARFYYSHPPASERLAQMATA